MLPRTDWGGDPIVSSAFHPSSSPRDFRLNPLTGSKRFPSTELPAVFSWEVLHIAAGLDWEICSEEKFSVPALSVPLCFSEFSFSWLGCAGHLLLECFSSSLLGAICLLTLINPDCLATIPVLANLQEATSSQSAALLRSQTWVGPAWVVLVQEQF